MANGKAAISQYFSNLIGEALKQYDCFYIDKYEYFYRTYRFSFSYIKQFRTFFPVVSDNPITGRNSKNKSTVK